MTVLDRPVPPELSAAVPLPAGARYVPMGGGRSNRLWRVEAGGHPPVVAKLYAEARGNVLFPNDAWAEARALRALSGTGLAPALMATADTGQGPATVYRFTPGTVGPRDPLDAARLLARLHKFPASGFRGLPGGTQAIWAQAQAMLDELDDRTAKVLRALRPVGEVLPAQTPVFLHGDPVPANMIDTGDGLVLIDWQCPALGDPCEDLAVFLSPAMHALYGGRDKVPTQPFLDAYGDPDIAKRYIELAPHFHWRMAVYCHWMSTRGATDYAPAADLELAALDHLRPNARSGPTGTGRNRRGARGAM